MSDRRTKAQILQDLDRVVHQLQQAEARIVPVPRRVPQADALAECIRALDALASGSSGRFSREFGGSSNEDVGDVVRYLIQRYSVRIVVPATPADCKRLHLEDASEGQLVAALQNPPMQRRGF